MCYDMSALGYIGEGTGEMRGFKIDPPTDYDGYVDVLLSGDMRYLAWATEPAATVLAFIVSATVVAFIVKGGPNYHVYDYVGSGIDADSWLASPRNNAGRIPEISHYNLCYQVVEGNQPGGGGEPRVHPGLLVRATMTGGWATRRTRYSMTCLGWSTSEKP